MPLPLPFFLLFLALPLPGQTRVSPAHFSVAGGNFFPVFGFQSSKTPCRIQQVHDDLAGAALTVKRLSFRRGWYDTSDFAPFSVTADLLVSTAAVSHGNVAAGFAANHGPDLQTVARGVKFSFPGAVYRRVPPVPFTYLLPFSGPFAFAGKGSFCWEIKVHSRTNTRSHPFDGFYRGDSMYYACRYYSGRGCRAAGRSRPVAIRQSHVLGATLGNLNFRAMECPASQGGFFAIGRSTTSWAGLSLPFSLPGTTGSASGTCTLSTGPDLFLPATSDPWGTMSKSWLKVPMAPFLHQVILHAQALVADPGANPLGLVTSDLASWTFRAPVAAPPIAVIHQEGGASSRIRRYTDRGLILRCD